MSELFTVTLLIRLVASFICSVAFAVLFRVAERYLFAAGCSGVLVYFIYHLVLCIDPSMLFAAAFLSTGAGAIFAEVYARIRRTPVTVILSPAIIPTVPGGDIYYTMQRLLSGAADEAANYFFRTMNVALGIAGGIVVIAIVFRVATDWMNKLKKRKSTK